MRGFNPSIVLARRNMMLVWIRMHLSTLTKLKKITKKWTLFLKHKTIEETFTFTCLQVLRYVSPLLSVDSILSHFLPWRPSSFFSFFFYYSPSGGFWPSFLFPLAAHVRAVTSPLFLSFLSMWPINFHLRLFTSLLNGSISALSNNFSVLKWSCIAPLTSFVGICFEKYQFQRLSSLLFIFHISQP